MYELNITEMKRLIKEKQAKKVMIQLPDGLKNKSKEIQEEIKKEIKNTQILFWAGSNFGACDLPTGIEKLGIDLLIHLGHTAWEY